MASWGLAIGPESRNSGEEGWGQSAQGHLHPSALLSGVPDTGIRWGESWGQAWGWTRQGSSKGPAQGWSKAGLGRLRSEPCTLA